MLRLGSAMSFSLCQTLYGQASMMEESPSVKQGDCIYSPFSRTVFFDQDPNWGIYDTSGTLVEEASYRRGPALNLIGQSPSKSIFLDDVAVCEQPCLYFGPLIPHYGHFLVTSLARAWLAIQPNYHDLPLICHSDHDVLDHFKGYMGVLVSALGLSASNFYAPTSDVRFTNLVIPSPAFVEEKLVHPDFVEPMHRIGDALFSSTSRHNNETPVWLSKSRMHKNSVAHVVNEDILEEMLADCGFDIIYPEQLSLPQQVELFSTRRHILGFAGSAFHNHIFSRNPPKLTCITLGDFVNSNLIMLDKINGVDAKYYHAQDNFHKLEVEGYAISRKIIDLRQFVADLLEIAELPGISSAFSTRWERVETLDKDVANDANCVADLQGENYQSILKRLHVELNPESYLEIGEIGGGALTVAKAPSILVDPFVQSGAAVKNESSMIGRKKLCLFFQMGSDDFFDNYDPKQLLGRRLDFQFLDGIHHCEFLLRDFMNAERHASRDGVIALHDCLPVEIPMTDRTQNGTPPVAPHRGGWWTGDVWRTLYVIKKHRPDLRVLCLDAAPTGLVLISNLNPQSTRLTTDYHAIVEEMLALDLAQITVARFLEQMDVRSTRTVQEPGSLLSALRP